MPVTISNGYRHYICRKKQIQVCYKKNLSQPIDIVGEWIYNSKHQTKEKSNEFANSICKTEYDVYAHVDVLLKYEGSRHSGFRKYGSGKYACVLFAVIRIARKMCVKGDPKTDPRFLCLLTINKTCNGLERSEKYENGDNSFKLQYTNVSEHTMLHLSFRRDSIIRRKVGETNRQ